MVSAIDSGSNGLDSSPGGDSVVFFGKTFYFHSAFLHLVLTVSHLTTPWGKQGKTLVGSGHVSHNMADYN